MAPPPSTPVQPLIGFGQVRHTRLKPQRHAFAYPTYFVMLPMRHLAASKHIKNNSTRSKLDMLQSGLSFNTWSALSFYDCDHGDGRTPEQGGALAWLDALLHAEHITDASGEIWLHCYPRVLGYTFKPVSFWYCHRTDGTLRAIVVEVNNTFGERHCYLLDQPRYGVEQRATKVFHVSPFCEVTGEYRFRFMRTEKQGDALTVVRIDYDDDCGPLLQTSVSGQLVPATPAAVRRALWRYPAMTFGLIARIHWQAVRLWLKRVKFIGKPVPPEKFVTR
jgi:DUF1365 family protein